MCNVQIHGVDERPGPRTPHRHHHDHHHHNRYHHHNCHHHHPHHQVHGVSERPGPRATHHQDFRLWPDCRENGLSGDNIKLPINFLPVLGLNTVIVTYINISGIAELQICQTPQLSY